MTEIDVAVTDYLLCIEAAWFAWRLFHLGFHSVLARYFQLTFISLSVVSFLGGTTHGFFNDPASTVHPVLWWATLLAIGVTAVGFGMAGYSLLVPGSTSRWRVVIVPIFLVYTGVTYIKPEFLVTILFYLPAILLCLAGFIAWGRQHPGQGAVYGIAGIVLSLLGSLGQQLGVSLHPVYLTHNTVYHIIMMVALLLVFLGAKKLLHYKEGSHG